MGKSKKRASKSIPEKVQVSQFNRSFNRNFSNGGHIYPIPDINNSQFPRQTFNDVYVHRPDYRHSYRHTYSQYYRPYYHGSNEAHLKNKLYKKPPSRPPSPTLGSEEYMVRKIQQTSANIMRQLLNPNEQVVADDESQISAVKNKEDCIASINDNVNKILEKPTEAVENKNKKKVTSYNIEEIHKKIISHITNMKDGKKKNLVLSNSSSYDIAIQQIQKQKRLDISRALRNMCSQSETQESSDFINSIIPDMGIKIEDLPRNLIEELTNTLNLDCESNDYCDNIINVLSQESGYCSSGNGQLYRQNSGEDIASVNSSLEDEGLHLQTYIKSEYTNDAVFLSLRDNISLDFNNEIEDSNENVGNIIIKKEFDQCPVDKSINSVEASNEVECLVPDISKEMCSEKNYENTENNIINIKQESDQYPEDDQRNTEVLNEPIRSNELEIDAIDGDIDMQPETNLLPINGEQNLDQNDIIKSEVKDEIEIIDNNLYNSKGQEHSGFFGSIRRTSDASIQTDENIFDRTEIFREIFLSKGINNRPPNTITEAVDRMLKIDECIFELTKYRQSLFDNLKKANHGTPSTESKLGTAIQTAKKNKKKVKIYGWKRIVNNRKKIKSHYSNNGTNREGSSEAISATENNESICEMRNCNQNDNNPATKSARESNVEIKHQKLLSFEEVQEKVLVIQAVEDKLVTATESGKIFMCSLENGHYTNMFQVSDGPITALWFHKLTKKNIKMYVGSYESKLKIYDFQSCMLQKTLNIDDSIQCLESNWGYIFMGCMRGTLMRYSIKKNMLEYDDKFSDDRILVIKAAQEGARKILLVGSRNSPLCIRDAMTGLYMRTMENIMSPTVYSLIMEKSLIYCGTTNHDILVYSFNDGKLINTYKVTSSKGISCLKIIKNLLFASCHNGNIYVYDIKTSEFIDSIQGPGGVILSMEVLENQVIVGTMSLKFKSLPIPQHILRCNCD